VKASMCGGAACGQVVPVGLGGEVAAECRLP
jgi:hypothetical protein